MSKFSFTKIVSLLIVVVVVAKTHSMNAANRESDKLLRAGMIGLDTSHVSSLAKAFTKKDRTGDMAKIELVAAFPGGSDDFEPSYSRVEKYTAEVKGLGVEIVDSIPKLLEKVDVVILLSVDGRKHFEQAVPVFKSGKPVYIDKPLGGNLVQAIAIHELGKKYKAPWFCSSNLRFSPGLLEYRGKNGKAGEPQGVSTWGPCKTHEQFPDLYWYGIHGTEMLYAIMGKGCESVTRVHAKGEDFVTGTWTGGKIGTYRGIRAPGKSSFGATVYGTKSVAHVPASSSPEGLADEIAKFLVNPKSPVDLEETVEIYAFLEAADESKRQDGKPVKIKDVMESAHAEAMKMVEKN